MRRFILVFAVCLAFLGAPSTAAADAPWQWEPAHAWWGWNYVTPTVNTWVAGPTNYWYLYQLRVGSGGYVSFAIFSYSASDWCYQTVPGPDTYYMSTASGPCGGYNRPYLGYQSGDQSYIRGDIWVL